MFASQLSSCPDVSFVQASLPDDVHGIFTGKHFVIHGGVRSEVDSNSQAKMKNNFDDDSRYLCIFSKHKYFGISHSEMNGASKKKARPHSEEYLKFGFIPAVFDEWLPFCGLRQKYYTHESMKLGCFEAHLKVKHNAHINSDLN
ncbi:hypothetical protein NPIL_507851 [Nephila pilipes]|uniref:Uncharacterized protein n=1 Tax=Nephila pilipes TaxID=299642 RepID=A0A8X6MU60_NEPPI|nr:hypothetical protein NPIL_507851 [Nephila pilipes]